MAANLLAGPAAEPWSVADLKAFLRVSHDDDDAVIASLLAAARAQIEALARCALINQRWRIALDRWPEGGRLRLRIGPLRELIAARFIDERGFDHALDVESFVIDAAAGVIAAPAWSVPEPGPDHAGLQLDFVLGFGETAAEVPELLRHAVRTLVAHWYENRGLAAIGSSVAMLPGSVAAMIASYRTVSL